MKFKSSKKLVSLFLAIMMVVTSVPAFAINASAATNSKYLFAYFTGNAVAEQKIRFATSTDGKKFSALNGGNPTVTQKTGTGCARDPYLFYSEKENCYYLLATDYDYSHNNWSDAQSTMTVWKSNDLIKWTSETHIDAKNIPGNSFENNLWAPQVLWDDAKQKYMVYYSTNVEGSKTVVYSYTTDLLDVTKYSAPEKISDFSFSIIDADITKVGNEYVMFAKYEGQSRIYASVSSSPNSFSNPVKIVSESESTAFEGPQLYKTATGYNLALDNFNNSGNVWVHEFTDAQFADFMSQVKSASSSQISIASKHTTTINQSNDGIAARHGSFISISDEQYNALQSAEFNANTVSEEGVHAFGINSSNLIARYLVNDATTDTTGKNSALTNNSVSWDSTQNAAKFTMGNKSYLSLSTSMLNGTTENGFTVSLYAKPSSSNNTPTIDNMQGRFFEFTTATYGQITDFSAMKDNFTYISEAHNGIIQVNNKNYNSCIAANPGSTNKYYNDWHLYTVSVSSSGITVYIDGVKSATTAYNEAVTYEGFINNLASCNLLIGASGWPDNTYDGYMKDFRVYNKAITDDEATKLITQYEFDYVIDNINNTKSYTFDTKIANADDNYMKNIVYSGNWGDSSWTSFNNYSNSTKNIHYFKVMGPSVAVGIYSGNDTDIRFPLISETGKGDNESGVTNYIGVDHLAYNDGMFNVGGANWERCKSWNNLTSDSDTSHNFSSNPNGGINRKENSADQRYQLKDSKTWKNYMTYNGSGNKETYYDVLTNPSFAYQADYTWEKGVFRKTWGSHSNYTGTVGATNQKFYVLNYQPLKELIESPAFKSNFQNVVDNEWMYDETALIEYYKMYRDILKFDLKSCDYSSEAAIINVANTIKNLKEGYYPTPKKLKQITVNFSFYNGDVTTKKIDAGSSLAGIVPSNTEIGSNNNGTHRVYTWSDNCSESTVPQKDTTYYETFENVDCSFGAPTTVDGVTTKTCTVCGYTKTEINLNKDAYNAAVESANAEIKNTAKNTAESIANLQAVLNDNSNPDSAQNQKQLDAMTSAILTAIEQLKLNTYTVKLYYVIDGTQSEVKEIVTDEYGKYFTFNAPAGNYSVEKWTRTIGTEKDEKVGATNTSLTGRIVNKADYFVYAKSVKPAKTDNAVVSLRDRLGRVVDNMYVPLTDGQATLTVSVDAANRSITVNGTIMTAPNVTFYTFNGFEINGEPVTNGTYTITGDTAINAVYDFGTTFTITTVNCKADHPSAYWDQKVTVTADNATDSTQWYVNGELVGYGKTYTFRANADVTVTCRNDTAVTVAPSAVVTRLSYNNPVEKTITAVAQLNVPEGYTVKEAGVLLKTSSVNNNDAVNNIENYTGSKANAKKFKANNFVKDTNQYVISVYASKTYDSLYVGAVAYVTYTYTDAQGIHESTAYSNLVTYDYNKA